MLGLLGRSFDLLRARKRALGSVFPANSEELLKNEAQIKKRFQRLRDRRINALRTRIHGDLHLGQALYTGKDFVLIDFEGTPSRPSGERRIKHSPVRDIASMLRSMHYAAHAAMFGQVPGVVPASQTNIEKWVEFWYRWSAAAFLGGYLSGSATAEFLPRDAEGLDILLDTYLLERALVEIAFEIHNRPDWVRIPVTGILGILQTP
jgi:maltose alpha-D-glucosyltransferase/alpha-amylase